MEKINKSLLDPCIQLDDSEIQFGKMSIHNMNHTPVILSFQNKLSFYSLCLELNDIVVGRIDSLFYYVKLNYTYTCKVCLQGNFT